MILYKKKFRYACIYIKKNSSDVDNSNIAYFLILLGICTNGLLD